MTSYDDTRDIRDYDSAGDICAIDAARETISAELRRIEREEGVRVLYACESGSRAWGFPSRDSDYDVRFLYVRTERAYLSLFPPRDVIERPISDRLDIVGWDLRKALLLMRKSNPPLLEWLQSPIRYEERGSAAERIRQLSPLVFSPRSCIYHYLHMAKGNYRDYLQGERVRLKKYFYVLRPILACSWIERFETMPQVEFAGLIEVLIPEGSELRRTIEELLARKMAGEELDDGERIELLNRYLDERIGYFERAASQAEAGGAQATERELDELFLHVLEEAWQQVQLPAVQA